MRYFKLAFFFISFWISVPVAAQEVSLRSADGGISLTGTLLKFDGSSYRLQTAFGVMTLNSAGLICDGHNCPNPAEYATTLSLSAPPVISENLLPALIDGYAFSLGQKVQKQIDSLGGWDFHMADAAGFPVATIKLTTTDTAEFYNIVQQKADLSAVTNRALTEGLSSGKSAALGKFSQDKQRYILALDGLVFITSKDNPVGSLSPQEISQVFSGEIVNWAELGGADAPIILYQRDPGADISKLFAKHIWPKKTSAKMAPGLVFKSNLSLSDAVAANPLAIGYTNFANIGNSKALGLSGPCKSIINPSVFTLKTGDYPFTQHLYLFTSDRRSDGFMGGLLSYLDRPESQHTIDARGFVSRKSSLTPFGNQGTRLGQAILLASKDGSLLALQSMIEKFSDASRMSTTFRFNEFSIGLDERSQSNSTQIAQLIERGDFDGKTLYIAGFSDDQGGAAGNRKISRIRANRVATAIRSAATKADLSRVSFVSLGFGEISPLACNETAWGRRVNRRVEIWVK